MTETALANRIDKGITGSMAIAATGGGVRYQNMTEAMEVAKMMAIGGVAVPKHLRGQPGACLALVMQGIEWGIPPMALANKSFSVNDRLSYEASVFQAVIQNRAPIKGRVKSRYAGAGDTRTCTVYAETSDDPPEMVEYTSPQFAKIQPKNSPLWRSDPDQQLHYYSVRAWCRRWFPDILLGAYTYDEIVDSSPITATGTSHVAPAVVAPAQYDIIDADPVPEVVDAPVDDPKAALDAIGKDKPFPPVVVKEHPNQPAGSIHEPTPDEKKLAMAEEYVASIPADALKGAMIGIPQRAFYAARKMSGLDEVANENMTEEQMRTVIFNAQMAKK